MDWCLNQRLNFQTDGTHTIIFVLKTIRFTRCWSIDCHTFIFNCRIVEMFSRKLRLLKSEYSLFLRVFTSSREIPCKSRSICCRDVCVDKQILKDTIGSQCGKCGGWIYCGNIFFGKMIEHSRGTPDCWWIVVISCVLWMSNDLRFEGLTSVLPLDIHPSGTLPKINRAHTIQVG